MNTPIETSLELKINANGGNIDPTYFKSVIGSIQNLICIRPDILYMEALEQSALNAAKMILCYIKGIVNDALFYFISLLLLSGLLAIQIVIGENN